MRAVMQPIYAAFRDIAPAVEAFARTHGLLIERYRRESATWSLRFTRHLGGEAAIVVAYREATGHAFDITALWWIDDYEARTRRLKSSKVGVYLRHDPPAALTALLDQALALIASWGEEALGEPRGPYQWKLSRAEWEADLKRLPSL
jgi:hypothetical protein